MHKDPARLPPLDLLVSFEAVARLGSITRAAAERFVTQSAMSRQVQALEEALDVPLFVRRHRAIALTEAGRLLHGTCASVLDQLRETVAAIRAPTAREQLAVTTTPSFAALWLIPRLAAFTRSHPGIDVRLDASYERRDLRREGFDLAVRYSPAATSAGERLFAEAIVPVCSPALVEASATPLARAADLAEQTLLQVMPDRAGGIPVEWESWLQSLGLPQVRPRSTLTFSNYNEAIAAAISGQGVALGRRPLIDALIARGDLVVPFGEATATERGYFLIVEPQARRRPAVQALEIWLLAEAGNAQQDELKPEDPAGDRSPAPATTGSAHRNAAPVRRLRSSAHKAG